MPTESIIADADETLADKGFRWRHGSGAAKVLVCDALENAGFVNAFSTRLGGVSPYPENALNLAGFGEDADENIVENRRRFLTAARASEYALAMVWQTHGSEVKLAADAETAARSNDHADAIVSTLNRTLAAVKTADCVPVLIGDPKRRVFAAAHAGWRGTAALIAVKTVRMMSDNFGSRSADLICAIGPAAGGRLYEVGREVIDALSAAMPDGRRYFAATRDGHALVDLRRANRDQLAAAGVRRENIFEAPFCTIERTDLFFSYRAEKTAFGKTGRLLSAIGLQ